MARFFSIFSLLIAVSIHLSAPLLAQEATSLWARPVIIGASLSDGYHHQERTGGPKSEALALDRHLKQQLNNSELTFTNYSNRLCFLSPLFISSRQVLLTKNKKPTIVIAVDQLFWQLYGRFPSSEARLETFQNALKQLDSITCPLVIGNIPDASSAVRLMLSQSQVPKLETINEANQILSKWVKQRLKNKQQTTVIDLALFMKQCISNKEIKLSDKSYPAGTTRRFLQKDMLHPTPSGVTAISHAILDALKASNTISQNKQNARPLQDH